MINTVLNRLQLFLCVCYNLSVALCCLSCQFFADVEVWLSGILAILLRQSFSTKKIISVEMI